MDFSRSFCHLSPEFREQMSSEFFGMVDSLISYSCSAEKDVDFDDDIAQVNVLIQRICTFSVFSLYHHIIFCYKNIFYKRN